MRCSLAALLLALLLPPFDSAQGQSTVPDELRAQLSVLNDEQIEFVTSGAVLDYIPQRQLEHELATRDADGLRTLMDDLMSLAEEMGYDPERDMGAAPLNLSSKRFNGRTLPTPAPLRELERAPGPFSVHRYLFPQSGVPTFGGAKVAIWPEDLVAGKVDVAIIGVPSDMSSGRRDAASGPSAMRAMDTIASPDMQSLIKPLEALSVVDYGNFSCRHWHEHRKDYWSRRRHGCRERAGTGAIPMIVGGDTSMLYPGVKGRCPGARPGHVRITSLQCPSRMSNASATTRCLGSPGAIPRYWIRALCRETKPSRWAMRGPAVDAETLQWLRSTRRFATTR